MEERIVYRGILIQERSDGVYSIHTNHNEKTAETEKFLNQFLSLVGCEWEDDDEEHEAEVKDLKAEIDLILDTTWGMLLEQAE